MMPSILAVLELMTSGVASVLSEGIRVGAISVALRDRWAVSISCGENLPGGRLRIGLVLRFKNEVVPDNGDLGLRGDGGCPHSSANFSRLLFGLVGIGSGVVSIRSNVVSHPFSGTSAASGAVLRFVRDVVSKGCGENLRLVFLVVSRGSGVNLRDERKFSVGSTTG